MSGFFKTTFGTTEGPHIFWWHGWGQSHASMMDLAELFKDVASHHVYDLPGFGKSDQLHEDADVQDYAEHMVGELKSVSGKRVIVGHSFGCRMAVRFAVSHPELVDALVLIAGAGIPKKRSLTFKVRGIFIKLLGKLARLTDSVFKTSFREAYSNKFGSADYKNAGTLRTTFVKTVNDNLSEIAKGVSVPVLLIYGDEDTETPVEVGEKYAAAINGSTLKVIKGFGHLDILSRGRNKIEPLIRRFLNHNEIGVM